VNLLSFTERAFSEALRLYPPAYTTSRQAIEPVEIGGYRLPAGAQVHLIPYLTHRDPRWFNDPQTFRPDRFAMDAEHPIPRFAFIPFGAGPRACVGGGLALMEGLLVVATILQRCRLQLAAGQREPDLGPLIALHPQGGIRLRILSRPEVARPTGR
jgi:cytochrome P450